jgi:hypothetical protein
MKKITSIVRTLIALFLLGLLWRLFFPLITEHGYHANRERAHNEIHYLVDRLDEYAHKDPQRKYPVSMKQLARQFPGSAVFKWPDLEKRYVYLPDAKSDDGDQPVVIERPGHYGDRVQGWAALGNTDVGCHFGNDYRKLLAKWIPELYTNDMVSTPDASTRH